MTMSFRIVLLAAIMLAAPAVLHAAVKLSAKDLYAGFDARKVLLDGDGGKLVLDARAVKFKQPGLIVTDPIDLVGGGAAVVPGNAMLTGVEIKVVADVPEGTEATVEARSGADMFDTSKWGEWTKLTGLAGKIENPAGPFVQVRITLKSSAADKLPAVREVELTPAVTYQKILITPVKVSDAKVQKIVRSPIEFVYERPDQPKIAAFRKAAKLDEVVAGAKDDFEKLVKLMDWAGSCHNSRGTKRETEGGYYQWDIDKIFAVVDGKPTVFGHCMSYSELLVTAATAMGYVGSRHMAIDGYQDRSHEICDIWTPSLGKWVYYDPSCTHVYSDKQTKVWLNTIELHKIVADKLVPDGKDMNWWRVRPSEETKAHLAKVGGGKSVVDCRMGAWHYGDPQDPNYDWGSSHGFVCTGFVQMTPRNDFNSNPKANPRMFSNLPGYANWPVWVDAKTPPRNKNWYTRMRDFYWTLDQASFRLVQTSNDTIRVEFGNSMPFFKSYQIKVDGQPVAGDKIELGNVFTWKLKTGDNKLEVAPVDEFGKVGLPSSATVTKGVMTRE